MKRIAFLSAMLFACLAWFITTDQVTAIKAVGQDTYTPEYQTYCTTQKTLTPDGKGRYTIVTGSRTIYIPASSARVETVEKCP